MKKLLLFVIACTLGLFGAVNAQETITIGEGGTTNGALPVDFYNGYGICQQLFTADEIGHADGGVITSMAIKFFGETTTGEPANPTTATFERKVDIYINSTELAELEGGVNLSAGQTPYFQGTVTYVPEEWTEFVFDTPYQYDGGNIIITMHDYTGGDYQNWYHFYADFIGKRAAYANITAKLTNEYLESNLSSLLWLSPSRNNIQLTFAAAGEGGEEPTPEPEPGDDLASEFSFDFEDGTLTGLRAFAGEGSDAPLLWTISNSDYYNAGNGTNVIYSESCDYDWNAYPSINNYIVTENAYAITAESKLSWYVRHTDYSVAEYDIYEVVVSTDGTNFSQIWSGAASSSAFSQEVSLAEYAGQNLYIGFRHYCTDSYGGGALVLDNIVLTAGEGGGEEPTPEPEPTPTVPATPEDYAANATSSSEIVLTWAAVEGATSYKIYYPIGTEEFVVDVTETTYTFENLEAYTSYCFAIAAVNEAGESAKTSYFCTTTFEEPTPVAPAAPANLVATANGQNSITLTWNAVEGATYYIVYKDGQMWDQVNGTTYTSTGLTAGTEYCYAVQAYDANDLESELSEEVCETTDPAFDIPEGVIWNCSVEFVLGDSYGDGWNNNNLYVSYGDVTEKLTLTGGKSTTYVLEIPKGTHVTVTYKPEGSFQSENTFGVRYYGDTEYICTQYTINNNQTYTHEFDVNCEPSMPSVPALTATATGGSTIVLTIEGAGAESYNIYEGEELFAEGVAGSTYTVEGLESETEYCFTATAVNFLGETEPSEAACATTLKAGIAIVQIGTGTTNTYQAPICDYYSSYSVSQMIYTEEEIGYGSGKVTSISFYQNEGTGPTRSLSVYMKNVSKDIFGNGTAEWEALEADMCVYQGSFTFGTSGWVEIALQNEFVYEAGNNLMVCVIDNTGSYPAGNTFEGFAADVVTDIKTIFGTGNVTDPLNITTNSYPLLNGTDKLRPIAKFVLEPAPADVKVKPETIAFGDAQLGEYWSENGAATIAVTVKPIITTITSITCDNEFFVLPAEIDYTANPIEFAVAYDHNAAAGEYTGNLTITYGDGATKVVPMTATAYAPATADVFELAQEITFTENAYTDTPVFANLHDDYNLPKEANNGNTPDAVYSFELAKESYVAVEVAGTNAVYALYQEDFSGEEGPKADNKVKGNGALSSFAYDFNDGNLDEFYMIEKDAVTENYKNHEQNWKVVKDGPDASNCLISFSYSSNPSIHDANNYIVTKDKYVISADSKLTFDAKNYGAGDPDYLKIEVSEDGENFTYLVTATPGMGAWESVEVELGTLLASAGLEYGEYHIALHHEEVYHMYIMVDNLALTSSNVSKISYPAGNYYLVAAAEDEFTVNVAIEALEGEEPEPTAKAYRLESVATSWGNTAYTYDEENTNTVVSVDEDGLITKVTYNEAGQIASAVATVEEVDEEGNPVETVISGVEYEYDENGVWTSFTETVQGWFGGTVTSETVLSYDAEGRLVSLTSEEYARTIAYNEAGLISEVVEGYILVEEEGEEGEEEGDEEGDDNGIAPLSETEIEYSSKITFEYDAEGRLVKKDYYFYDAYETMEFYWGESEVYTYDENGNCVRKESYEVTEENELNSFPYSVAEYIYDLTINNEDVYSFEYPHFAFINYVEPSYVNILVKEMSYYNYYEEDVEDVVSHSYDVTAYNYNPAVVSLPFTPMNLTAEVLSATEVELAWAGFPDAESFTLYSADTVFAEGIVDPYYTVENLEMGVEYCFAVMATNSVGNSEVSETVCVTIELPAAPANLVAEATSETEIALTWDEVPGIYSYNVYQVVETAEETTYELLGEAWWVEYTVSELTAETEYSFVVKAVSNVGESAASNVATATTLAPPAPQVPAAPVVTGSFTYDTIHLVWEPVESALYYTLYYNGKQLGETFEDTRVDIQVPSVGTYCFTVTATNEIGESAHSENVCVEVVVPEGMVVPAAPELNVELDGDNVVFSWEEVEGATYYNVYVEVAPGNNQYLGTATMEDLPITMKLKQPGEYCFFATAVNLAGESELSEKVCVTYGEGVEENATAFNIYPNPVSDRLVIETEANIEAVTIYTVTGVVVYSEVDFNNNTIDVSDFANGVYVMKVRTENGEAVQRFIKK